MERRKRTWAMALFFIVDGLIAGLAVSSNPNFFMQDKRDGSIF
jgi:hypothetical protein